MVFCAVHLLCCYIIRFLFYAGCQDYTKFWIAEFLTNTKHLVSRLFTLFCSVFVSSPVLKSYPLINQLDMPHPPGKFWSPCMKCVYLFKKYTLNACYMTDSMLGTRVAVENLDTQLCPGRICSLGENQTVNKIIARTVTCGKCKEWKTQACIRGHREVV